MAYNGFDPWMSGSTMPNIGGGGQVAKPQELQGMSNNAFIASPSNSANYGSGIANDSMAGILLKGTGKVDIKTGKTTTPLSSSRTGTVGVSGAGGLRVRPSSPSTFREDLAKDTARLNQGGGSSSSSGGDVSYLTPTMPKPTIGEFPEYNMPEMDRERIGELTELSMGAPMGRLKQGLDRALIEARYSDNPTIRDLSRKSALSGYGDALTDVRAGAHREAVSEYMPEFNAAVSKAGAEYNTGVSGVNTKFQSDLNEYLRTMQQTRTSMPAGDLPNPGTSLGVNNSNIIPPMATYKPPGGVLIRR